MFEPRAPTVVPSRVESSYLPDGPAAQIADPCAVSLGRRLDAPPRYQLLSEGELASAVFWISSGEAMLSKVLPDGRRQIIELLGPNDVFGFSDSELHDTSAETLTSATVVRFERRQVDTNPGLQLLLGERLQRQVRKLHDHAILLGRKNAREKVASFLMIQVGSTGCFRGGDADPVKLHILLTRRDLADYLGMTFETVSRTFSALRRAGIISYLHGHSHVVTVNDVGRLYGETGEHFRV